MNKLQLSLVAAVKLSFLIFCFFLLVKKPQSKRKTSKSEGLKDYPADSPPFNRCGSPPSDSELEMK